MQGVDLDSRQLCTEGSTRTGVQSIAFYGVQQGCIDNLIPLLSHRHSPRLGVEPADKKNEARPVVALFGQGELSPPSFLFSLRYD